jgi:ribosomal protein S25
MTATLAIGGALDTTARRDSLLALIKEGPRQPVTTKRAQDLYAVTPWSGIGRNAARRDLRDLARRGQLIPRTVDGQRSYVLYPQAIQRIPMGPRLAKSALLQAITDEGGEWTPGRAKAILHRAMGTNVYRSVARRCLDDLHRAGLVELHSERPGHCFYVSLIEGGAA